MARDKIQDVNSRPKEAIQDDNFKAIAKNGLLIDIRNNGKETYLVYTFKGLQRNTEFIYPTDRIIRVAIPLIDIFKDYYKLSESDILDNIINNVVVEYYKGEDPLEGSIYEKPLVVPSIVELFRVVSQIGLYSLNESIRGLIRSEPSWDSPIEIFRSRIVNWSIKGFVKGYGSVGNREDKPETFYLPDSGARVVLTKIPLDIPYFNYRNVVFYTSFSKDIFGVQSWSDNSFSDMEKINTGMVENVLLSSFFDDVIRRLTMLHDIVMQLPSPGELDLEAASEVIRSIFLIGNMGRVEKQYSNPIHTPIELPMELLMKATETDRTKLLEVMREAI